MKKIIILALIWLLPTVTSEMSHSPNKLSEGNTFTALIDTNKEVISVTFYVCTLEEPYTCYKPEKMERNNTTDGRFQFSYTVKNNDYPGYKYEIEKEGKETEKIPVPYPHYDGLEVKEMGDSHYFKVNIKVSDSEEKSLLSYPSFLSSVAIISMLVLAGRRWI